MADVSLVYTAAQSSAADPFPGWMLHPLKDALVAAGWTVRGSGDGLGRFGHVDAATTVPGAQQGSGGDYDCWSSANVANGIAGGAGNSEGWCHLRSPGGLHDLLIGADPATSFPQSHLGVVGFTREDVAGFDGTSANATTKPTVATSTDAVWVVGSGPSSGGYLSSNVIDPSVVLNSSLILLDGGEEFVVLNNEDNTGTSLSKDSNVPMFGVTSVVNPHPDDPDPWYYVKRSVDASPFSAWNYLDSAWFANYSIVSSVSISDSRSAPDEALAFPYIDDDTGTPTMAKGVANPDMWLGTNQVGSFGDRYTEVTSGRVYMHIQPSGTSRLHLRWPDAVTDYPNIYIAQVDEDVWDPFYTPTVAAAPSAPTVTVVDPPEGSSIGRTQAITIEVTDTDGLAYEQISLYDTDTDTETVIHKNGATRAGFGVTRTAIADGFRYVITRTGGWAKAPTFLVDGVDVAGGTL